MTDSMVRLRLASASSRRREWLEEILGPSVKIESTPLTSKEPAPGIGSVAAQVAGILEWKIESVGIEMRLLESAGEHESADLVVVADTLVEDPIDPTNALGQPANVHAAATQLLLLSGGRHLVWSGTAIISPDEENGWRMPRILSKHIESSVVEMKHLSEDQMSALLDSESWRGKAGGYDLAGPMGDYANVVEGAEVCVLGFAPAAIKDLHGTLETLRN